MENQIKNQNRYMIRQKTFQKIFRVFMETLELQNIKNGHEPVKQRSGQPKRLFSFQALYGIGKKTQINQFVFTPL
jgi:hypothetical protein